MSALRTASSGPLRGEVRVPGDKSISHRALIMGALAVGETRITGLLEAEDVLATATALQSLGAHVERGHNGMWTVAGAGIGGLTEAERVLDLGNSGTGVRLLMGVAAAHPHTTFFTGDKSLIQRPMARVVEPLMRMGALVQTRAGGCLPLSVKGALPLLPIEYHLPVPSAQVKSAVLLAGLGAPGETTIIEAAPTRDHTERLLTRFGAEVRIENTAAGRRITLTGEPELVPAEVHVPGDPSSAAFVAIAALLVPGSEICVTGIGNNPHRTGLLDTLREMGAELEVSDEVNVGGEPMVDLIVRTSSLAGVTVPAERMPSMIDEIPVLAIAAAAAVGETRLEGLGELRVKESDRLAAVAGGLAANGVDATVDGEALVIQGCAGPPPGGGTVHAPHDHRIAMAFAVLGMTARAPVKVNGTEAIATSFPGFAGLFANLGAKVTTA